MQLPPCLWLWLTHSLTYSLTHARTHRVPLPALHEGNTNSAQEQLTDVAGPKRVLGERRRRNRCVSRECVGGASPVATCADPIFRKNSLLGFRGVQTQDFERVAAGHSIRNFVFFGRCWVKRLPWHLFRFPNTNVNTAELWRLKPKCWWLLQNLNCKLWAYDNY